MHPYSDLPEKQFWSSAVGKRPAHEIADLWSPKWVIDPAQRIVTFGSCFAQHIGREPFQRGYFWANYEPAPRGLSFQNAAAFNFGVFSARTGNIYTSYS